VEGETAAAFDLDLIEYLVDLAGVEALSPAAVAALLLSEADARREGDDDDDECDCW